MAQRSLEKYLVYNLRETYHELGQYEFKVVLSPKLFRNSHLSSLTLVDSDGKAMSFELNKWGRKMNCSFVVDKNVADGVSTVKLSLVDDKEQPHDALLRFWVIKP
ncbi:MAG: hypothetical protein ACYDHY_07610 [Acidiferrobacterales bacterium]